MNGRPAHNAEQDPAYSASPDEFSTVFPRLENFEFLAAAQVPIRCFSTSCGGARILHLPLPKMSLSFAPVPLLLGLGRQPGRITPMEFVYVVRRRDLFLKDCPQGFQRLSSASFGERYGLAIRDLGFFVERRQAERDAGLKQIIPYCITLAPSKAGVAKDSDTTRVVGDASTPPPSILCLRRLPKQGERRLHGKLSIGIGGHINPVDGGSTASGAASAEIPPIVADGAAREIVEELDCDAPALQSVGVINDDSTPVGSVHFGVVFLARVAPDTSVRERDAMEGEWTTWKSLRSQLASGANYESWSSLIIQGWPTEEFLQIARDPQAHAAQGSSKTGPAAAAIAASHS